MRQFDEKQHAKTRNPERPGDTAGLALPARVPGTLFQGWGPKLMLAALAVSALSAPALAQLVSYIPESATGYSQGEPDRLTAIETAYGYADSIIQGGCTHGTVQNETTYSESDAQDFRGLWWANVVLTAACLVGN
jgi:hypothetical protein